MFGKLRNSLFLARSLRRLMSGSAFSSKVRPSCSIFPRASCRLIASAAAFPTYELLWSNTTPSQRTIHPSSDALFLIDPLSSGVLDGSIDWRFLERQERFRIFGIENVSSMSVEERHRFQHWMRQKILSSAFPFSVGLDTSGMFLQSIQAHHSNEVVLYLDGVFKSMSLQDAIGFVTREHSPSFLLPLRSDTDHRSDTSVPIPFERENQPNTFLSFPQGIAPLQLPGGGSSVESEDDLFGCAGLFAVADTNHNRILILELVKGETISLKVKEVIGNGNAGVNDGTFDLARFSAPKGLHFVPDDKILLVADWGNSSVRAIDLEQRKVYTLAAPALSKEVLRESAKRKRLLAENNPRAEVMDPELTVKGGSGLGMDIQTWRSQKENGPSWWTSVKRRVLGIEAETSLSDKDDLKVVEATCFDPMLSRQPEDKLLFPSDVVPLPGKHVLALTEEETKIESIDTSTGRIEVLAQYEAGTEKISLNMNVLSSEIAGIIGDLINNRLEPSCEQRGVSMRELFTALKMSSFGPSYPAMLSALSDTEGENGGKVNVSDSFIGASVDGLCIRPDSVFHKLVVVNEETEREVQDVRFESINATGFPAMQTRHGANQLKTPRYEKFGHGRTITTDVAFLHWGRARVRVELKPPAGFEFAAPFEVTDTFLEGALVETSLDEMLDEVGETAESVASGDTSGLGKRDGGANEGYAAWLSAGDEFEFDEERMREKKDIIELYRKWKNSSVDNECGENKQIVDVFVSTCRGSAYITVDGTAFLKRKVDEKSDEGAPPRSIREILDDEKEPLRSPFVGPRASRSQSVNEESLPYYIPPDMLLFDSFQVVIPVRMGESSLSADEHSVQIQLSSSPPSSSIHDATFASKGGIPLPSFPRVHLNFGPHS
uniref:Uncharacterized protein n=1 Tax=Palpitomonas bilix TaxID=652834 RepID=A0A7S3LW80_9EUKA|mmetsp:Transcript_5608/g.13046  ORF Transcript_5608/g.13046 Transcript_5608/m.13046 type:complete len:889 (+) Transcript_5608:186-2852(+)